MHLDGGRHEPERPRAQSGVYADDVSTCAGAGVVLGAHAAGEDMLRDVDLMFFTIDLSGGTHAAASLHIGCPPRVAARGQRSRNYL
ncbi:MAG: hypothetical protein JF610_05640 [Acidobacteria bacterium]|nr:hypothetical protein [Acidobacteriota bacterium]MBW8866807.1 hypothetical protein [Acidobacteriota bacterium]